MGRDTSPEAEIVYLTLYNYLYFNASNRGLRGLQLYNKSRDLIRLAWKGISNDYDFEFNPVVGKFCGVSKRLYDFGFRISSDQFVMNEGRNLHRDHEIIHNIVASIYSGQLTEPGNYTKFHGGFEVTPFNHRLPTATDYSVFFQELSTPKNGTSSDEKAIAELSVFLNALAVPIPHRRFVGSIIVALNRHPEMNYEELLEELGLRLAKRDLPPKELPKKDLEIAATPIGEAQPSNAPATHTPLPTHEEAEAVDKSGSQSGSDSPSLPQKAPALWRHDKLPSYHTDDGKLDTPPAFIMRHYGQWVGKGLLREHIEALDPDLAESLQKYLSSKKGRRPLPEGFDLPTRKVENDRWVARVLETRSTHDLKEFALDLGRQAAAARRLLQKGEGNVTEDDVRELSRKASAARRRLDKGAATTR